MLGVRSTSMDKGSEGIGSGLLCSAMPSGSQMEASSCLLDWLWQLAAVEGEPR